MGSRFYLRVSPAFGGDSLGITANRMFGLRAEPVSPRPTLFIKALFSKN